MAHPRLNHSAVDVAGGQLAESFLSAVPVARRAELTGGVGLAERLAALVANARGRWPKIDVSPEEFVRHVAERVGAESDIDAALRDVHGADLYLACGCASGDPRALSELERAFFSEVARYVMKLDGSPAFADEVRQLLREKLFAPARGRPKILDYSGRGPLGGWLRVAAVRTARNFQRGSKSPLALARSIDDQIRTPKPDPELSYLKQHYARAFREAFEQTLGELSPRERNILRLHFIEALSSSAIGAMYRVSGATVRLWIKQWREAILAQTRRRLATRLRTDTQELDGVMGLVQSQLDLTISRLLR